MRKLGLVVIALALLVGAALSWPRQRPAALTPMDANGASVSLVSSTVPDTTLPPLSMPQPVCFRHTKSGGAGHAPIPIEVCKPWRAADTWSGSTSSIYTTVFRPDVAQPAVIAYASWIRTSTTDLALYLGYEGPGTTTLPRGPDQVPPTVTNRLLATFNSGFYEKDLAAGFYTNHTLYYPMVNGLATVERFTNGRVDVVRWTGGPRPPGNILMARQNLPLLVNVGAATPLSANNEAWGSTLGGVPAVWRSALGVDANGNLIYVAAPDETSATLAALLVRLHAVRAMELDINPAWPIFVTYGGAGAQRPSLFVANPNQFAWRFLSASQKDFFAVYASRRPGEPQPW
ncbi:MAG: phosphodiester glycosidase family protein [Acidimicrobiales bacterium]